ncbi:MAG TPA: hypothetical protein PLD84_15180, partial [Chitinophagales bacterium]|nr:hypothetical protein [Chitinophagales bacterium]
RWYAEGGEYSKMLHEDIQPLPGPPKLSTGLIPWKQTEQAAYSTGISARMAERVKIFYPKKPHLIFSGTGQIRLTLPFLIVRSTRIREMGQQHQVINTVRTMAILTGKTTSQTIPVILR